jgi:hypothetical protein
VQHGCVVDARRPKVVDSKVVADEGGWLKLADEVLGRPVKRQLEKGTKSIMSGKARKSRKRSERGAYSFPDEDSIGVRQPGRSMNMRKRVSPFRR